MIFHAIGLMSGTSLDGLDICFARFQKEDFWSFEILKAETVSYDKALKNQLKNAIHLSAEELLELNSSYGFYLGKSVKSFIENHQLTHIDVIASHGHTIFHQPEKKFTLQIGDGRAIKLEANLPVVYDFRSQDILMGGNGAPLVPIGDELLFPQYDACLNLGGFSNISLKIKNQRIAFDIAPVNIVLNQLAKNFDLDFDENGNLAKRGTINEDLLLQINSLSFYQNSHPKSLGVEWCNENIFPLLENIEKLDALSTFTEHAAVQIAKVLNEKRLKNVLVTGGGAYNQYLIERIRGKTMTDIIIPEKEIIEYKEALIFALMGILRMNNEINVLSTATGSSYNHSSGIIA
ncbi:anhydro-N-acetylmuramic acid kinase [Chryseobacterium taichungense]|uniref:anhydro-N-acetylmuramic acid kinase n=1 Tax=Chryseobacterium taichungense TaxID=295069 RepID=UPI0028AF1489|nr:anhydro-N-acetylmuramic acid kinase [Chryseobacterium taichungense]